MVNIVTLVLFAVLIVLLTIWFIKRKRQMSILSRHGIPGPKPKFFFGNIFDLYRKQPITQEKWLRKYGKICGYYWGPKPMVLIADPELLKQIHIRDFHKFSDRLHPIPNGADAHPKETPNLVFNKGKKWKEMRSILTPTFSSSKLKTMVPIIESAIDVFMRKLDSKSTNGEEFEIYEMYQKLTMDVIGRAAFGVQTNVQENNRDPFLEGARSVFEPKVGQILLAIIVAIPELDTILWPIRRLKAIIEEFFNKHELAKLFQLTHEVIAHRRKNPKLRRNDLLQLMLDAQISQENLLNMKNDSLDAYKDTGDDINEKHNNVANGKSPKNGTISSKSLNPQKVYKLTDFEIESNAFIFLVAGFETTSTALAFITHMLINYPDVQEKMRQEVLDLYKSDGKLDYNVVTKLQYMERVMNETMRIYSPVTTFFTREALEDYPIGDGMTIPKGTYVQTPICYLHNDPELWSEPEKFDPDRFLPENRSSVHSSAWQPFGEGPRNCIGMRFALLEAKHTLARILIKYRLEPCSKSEIGKITIDYKQITQTPKNGVFLKLVPI